MKTIMFENIMFSFLFRENKQKKSGNSPMNFAFKMQWIQISKGNA